MLLYYRRMEHAYVLPIYSQLTVSVIIVFLQAELSLYGEPYRHPEGLHLMADVVQVSFLSSLQRPRIYCTTGRRVQDGGFLRQRCL